MLIKLVEVCKESNYANTNPSDLKYSLRETFINPDHVICLREETQVKVKLNEISLIEDLDPRQQFTRVYLNRGQTGLDITVVGSLEAVQEKLQMTKRILKG